MNTVPLDSADRRLPHAGLDGGPCRDDTCPLGPHPGDRAGGWHLVDLLDQLPREQAAVLQAVIYDRLSLREYARRSGMDRGTARRRYSRAITSLQHSLKDMNRD